MPRAILGRVATTVTRRTGAFADTRTLVSTTEADALTATEVNAQVRNLMKQGYGTIVIRNPRGKHSLGVGILSRLNLIFQGSLGYFAVEIGRAHV